MGKISVMVAETETLLRRSIKEILTRDPFNYSVVEATNGLEVIEILKERDIDILIINSLLPRVSGVDIISLIRKAERKQRKIYRDDVSPCDLNFDPPDIRYIYIISLIESEIASDTTVSDIAKAGSDDFIFKPFSFELFKSKLSSAGRIVNLQEEIRQIYREIYTLSTTDTLTGVWNRRTIIKKLYKQICVCLREHKALAVFMVDIDHFKKINDTYGHLFGDRALAVVAETLRGCCRIYDEIGRYGGEEFVIITPLYSDSVADFNCSEGAEKRERVVEQIGQRLIESVRENVRSIEGKEVNITISVGATILDCTLPRDGKKDDRRDEEKISCKENGELAKLSDMLLKQADESLYEAKKQGRDRFMLYKGETPPNGGDPEQRKEE